MSSKVAKDVMTREVLSVSEDLSVSDLAGFLYNKEITGAPVEGASGKVVGVVSVVDIARAESDEAEGSTVWDAVVSDSYHSYNQDWDKGLDDGIRIFHLRDSGAQVKDIMNRSVHSVSEDTPIPEVVEKLLRFHLHRVLVTDGDRLLGIISTSDLLKLLL